MKLDILAFGVHPDDVELGCGGTLIRQVRRGNKIGIVDLTRGELGTRGTAEKRDVESEAARIIIGAAVRENLRLEDGLFELNNDSKMSVIRAIRTYQPSIVLCNAINDRHPDHGRASQLVEEAAFYAGLMKIQTTENGENQLPWRPNIVLHYIQDRYIQPNIVVDISEVWEQKMESVLAHSSQFYHENSTEPETYIGSKLFLDNVKARHMEFGRSSGFVYAEGFTCARIFGITDLTVLH